MANNTIFGRTSDGNYLPVRVNSSGEMLTVGGTASGGTAPVTISGTPTATIAGTVIAESPAYTTVVSGELAVGTAAGGTSTTSIACKLVRFKARNSNAGTVFMGGGTTVTVPDGTTDTTTGLGLIANDDTGWIPCDNVSRFVFISSGTANAVTYLAVR